MSSKRVAKSAVDWAALAKRVPPNQKEAYRAFKAKSDMFVSRVHKHNESLPKIDFAYYRSRIAAPAMVDQFEKAYQAVTIPYPKDAKNMKVQIDKDEKTAQEQSKAYVANLQKMIDDSKQLLDNINSVPPYEDMTHQMYVDYFPDQARNPVERPTFWPHLKKDQPENNPHTIN
ncbi:hypothetical protein LSH36_320g05009 [Paralvinella palmiformis]|uniref:ATP synthase subunit d, mitochondrial n=1 Tax=Paralvinella palmiformis TaxID=53620 RepID=A0AAD9JGK1_9ANNE|nr:hypothetical protein LSH36_320g05009 [Paralvinella palmiformis]